MSRFPQTLARLTALTTTLLLPHPTPATEPATQAAAAAAARQAVASSASAMPVPSDPLLHALLRQAPGLDPEVLARALDAMRCAVAAGEAERDDTLTVIDYSLPSTAKRLWVFDVEGGRLLFHELVAHGKNTGRNRSKYFSNTLGSLQTSLGLFRTAEPYYGKNGYSLRLHGLEPGVNDLAFPRTIVVHGAWYVSRDFATRHGRLGRSWGCPAVREKVARRLIDTIKGGSLLFAYYPEQDWLRGSRFVGACGAGEGAPTVATAG